MMLETTLSRSMRLMFSSGIVLGFGMLASQAFAQEATDPTATQRVEITGSSIKRIVKEGSLPVQVLTAEDIKKTGATSASDLIQNLPAMQGFVSSSSSINGGGGGVTTAALHSLPSKYTLVLLDGQRVAAQGGAVNLESIPLDAVERVEILTDGASALYGSDAIAGVVNFILKKNKTDGDVYFTGQVPQQPGARSMSAGISKGWGNLEEDGYNVLLSYSHDQQGSLEASQRSFSAQGAFFGFNQNGTHYVFNQRTGNTTPANVNISAYPAGHVAGDGEKPVSVTLNPYYAANGNCGSALAGLSNTTAPGSQQCRFNYGATVEDLPQTQRDSGLIKGTLKIKDVTSVFATLMVSKFDLTGQFAPSAQPLTVSPTSLPSLYNTYVTPYLTSHGLSQTGVNSTLGYRTVSLGGRTDDFQTNARHFSTGINTAFAGWDLNAVFTLSNSVLTDTAAGGYSDYTKLTNAIASGAYDPVMNTGTSALNPALLNGTQFSKSTTTIDAIKFGAQHDLFEMAGGTSIISLGADLTRTHVNTSYNSLILSGSGFSTQPASNDFPVGGNYGQVPLDVARNNYGLSAEWLLPVAKTLEATVSTRYDSYAKTQSGFVFNPVLDANGNSNQIGNTSLGNSFSKTTYKLSARWTPVDTFLMRASYGTGFKAPSMQDIGSPLTFAGSTAGTYACPVANTYGTCLPGNAQYDLISGGNAKTGADGLKAENSKQWTIGFRVEPGFGLSMGADLWKVQIKNQVLEAGIPEQVGFANPAQYAALFVNPYLDGAGVKTIGYIQSPINGGVANYQGIDWDFTEKLKTPVGPLALAWAGTYMVKQNYTFVPGGAVLTDLGVFGPDQAVVFRVQMHALASLTTGRFTNSLSANYKSGYHDETYTAGTGVISVANADGSPGTPIDFAGLQVGSYTTFDYQGRFDYSKKLNFTAGVKNLFDRNPPLSLQNGGGGNMVGYDGRYADPIGRAYYVTGHYKF